MSDPFIGKPGYWPDTSTYPNGTFHLTPYGWALDPRSVAQSYTVQLLDSSGGAATGTSVTQATAILMNLWKHTIQGHDLTSSDPVHHPADPAYFTVTRDLLAPFFAAVKSDANYPFPGKNSRPPSGNYPTWLSHGIFLHVQPMPGFQRNLLRYYTAWGAIDLYNQASDLFVRSDGAIELPAIQVGQNWLYVPIVTQTWDGSQCYTVLNLTTGTVPSTYDDYPGAEYYLPGNVYLPGKAGVVQAYVDYLVYGNVGLVARQTDLWMGLKGDTADDMLFWASAPVSGSATEPGGMANKPYMFGASTYKDAANTWHRSIRLQSSNSFCVARLAAADLQNKLYDASLYACFSDAQGYQRAATISYQWRNFTLDSAASAGKWKASPDALGAGVPQLIFADTLGGAVAVQASPSVGWNDAARVLSYGAQQNVDLGNLSAVANKIGSNIYEYFATADSMNAAAKFLVVLNERQDWQGGTGNWSTAGNWVSGSVPAAYNNVYLEQSDGLNRSVTYNNTLPAAPSLSMLRLNATGVGTMTLQVNSASPAGDLSADLAMVGASGTGAILQTAGKVTLTDKLYLGYERTAHGAYTFQNGTLITPSALVGVYGTGAFSQSNGAVTISDSLTLAANAGSSGTYNLTGGALNVGTINQKTGGTLHQTGGAIHYLHLNMLGGSFVGDLENRTLLTGTGTITGHMINSGTISPGHSPGTLNVVGSFTQTAGGVYLAEIASPTSFDQIAVTGAPGTANLSGTLAPAILNGFQPRGNQSFPVITASGGVTGAFSTVLNQQITPTLFWQTRYNPNRVDLWVERRYTDPGLYLNSNQRAVGRMLNRVAGVTAGDLDATLNFIDYLPNRAAVQDVYKQISPEKTAAFSTLGFAVAHNQMRSLSQRLTDLRFSRGQSGTALGPGLFNLSYSRTGGLMLAYNASSVSGLITGARDTSQAPESPWSIYLQPSLIMGSRATTTNQTGFDFTAAGFTLGADYRLRDNLLLGLTTGYSHTGAGFRGSGGSIANHTWPLSLYLAYLPQPFYAFGSLGYSLNLFNLERRLAPGGLNRRASGAATGNQLNAYAETGYDFTFKRLVATPMMSLACSQLWVNGYTESGAGSLNLRMGPQSATSLQTGVGGKLAMPLRRQHTLIVPQAYASYQHEFMNGARGLDARLSQGGGTFTWQTDGPQRDFALLGANCTISRGRLTLQVDYHTEVGRADYQVHNVNGALRWQF